jgi:predicted glutamine amidotransferase
LIEQSRPARRGGETINGDGFGLGSYDGYASSSVSPGASVSTTVAGASSDT